MLVLILKAYDVEIKENEETAFLCTCGRTSCRMKVQACKGGVQYKTGGL
jgi:hypothetical protein